MGLHECCYGMNNFDFNQFSMTSISQRNWDEAEPMVECADILKTCHGNVIPKMQITEKSFAQFSSSAIPIRKELLI